MELTCGSCGRIVSEVWEHDGRDLCFQCTVARMEQMGRDAKLGAAVRKALGARKAATLRYWAKRTRLRVTGRENGTQTDGAALFDAIADALEAESKPVDFHGFGGNNAT